MTPDTLFTWDALATLAGASLLVYLIVAYTGRLADQWWPWGTDLYAVCVAAIVLILAQLATGAPAGDWRVYALAAANAFLVAAAAGKLRDKVVQEIERKGGGA